ncbi:hypothetical protein F383_21363 [Gossypium arboreum]|uniref:Uncharacterized protein n=1 Tax=Gossypium arboreum TaxID=29729 RepID=A0A0B0MQ49_GOSAR|nr:hypothetical protein F383_22335 [Gossypium arboreum]KHG17766.1 hypothetical protein F383_21363 [Gossypium arboreum]
MTKSIERLTCHLSSSIGEMYCIRHRSG